MALQTLSKKLHSNAKSPWIWSRAQNNGFSVIPGRQHPAWDRALPEHPPHHSHELARGLCQGFTPWTFPDLGWNWGARRTLYVDPRQKNRYYLLTVVERNTRCVLSWDLVQERTPENMQACLDQGPRAQRYYSDMFHYYSLLDYTPATHRSHNDKSQTYSVESVNADFRHYLRRFARRSKCFSRSLRALRLTITFFVYCHNRRQLAKRLFPHTNFGLSDFVPTWLSPQPTSRPYGNNGPRYR